MTIGQRVFHLLEEKNMTQREFSRRTGIATNTISNWKKKNTNPGSDKIMCICAALEVTPEYLLSGVTEDSKRGKEVDFMVIPSGTKERELLEMFNDMEWIDREHLLDYAKKTLSKYAHHSGIRKESDSLEKIAEFNDIEIFMDSNFEGKPSLAVYYIDDDITGTIDIQKGLIEGDFSEYVRPVIYEWLNDNRAQLLDMWGKKKIELLPEWE
ncbi:helix-turn-helix domain-containing protein [Butyrivibrio sp. WCD3002]|uniref:helix-turn-helix domain-containing protein n=1 Tax=Butyrivibrio sp. WCD3002 TaxID=1280676 RepID=UPI0004183C34|nr:helix-turn-helix transcriptional regulator [Butyrivibrio sp. WCD3002]